MVLNGVCTSQTKRDEITGAASQIPSGQSVAAAYKSLSAQYGPTRTATILLVAFPMDKSLGIVAAQALEIKRLNDAHELEIQKLKEIIGGLYASLNDKNATAREMAEKDREVECLKEENRKLQELLLGDADWRRGIEGHCLAGGNTVT
jgi:hypothetical protein